MYCINMLITGEHLFERNSKNKMPEHILNSKPTFMRMTMRPRYMTPPWKTSVQITAFMPP